VKHNLKSGVVLTMTVPVMCVSRTGKTAIFALFGCCTAWITSYRRFGTTYRSHLQESNSPRRLPITQLYSGWCG